MLMAEQESTPNGDLKKERKMNEEPLRLKEFAYNVWP